MRRDHSTIDELLAVRALHGLDGDDVATLERELAAHGECEECRRLEREHAEVAATLALSLDPRPIDAAIADRIVAGERRGPTPLRGDGAAARPDVRVGRWQAAFGVAAAVALVLAIALAVRPGGEQLLGRTIVGFEGGPGDLAAAFEPGRRGVVLWGTGLPDPGPDRVYELWLIEDGEPVRGACLRPTDGRIAAFVDADVGNAELMAVTVESPACPDEPTADPVYTAPLA
jgi:hypothetical protein